MIFSTGALAGLLAAFSWGTGDFMGGLLSRRSSPFGITIIMQVLGALFMTGLALFAGEAASPASTLLWSVAAGAAGSISLLLLYISLARGAMGIAAPIVALVGAIIPILVASVTLGAPSAVQLSGFVLALAAVWLLAANGSDGIQWRTLALPVLAGVFTGLYFVLMARAGEGGLYWPIAVARSAAALVLIALALVRGQPLAPPRLLLPMAILVAIFDTVGHVAYVVATQSSRMDTAAVLSSLYPAVTALLAWLFLKEHLSPPQWAGVAAALTAITLIVA